MEGKEKGRKEAVEANVVHSGLLKKIRDEIHLTRNPTWVCSVSGNDILLLDYNILIC